MSDDVKPKRRYRSKRREIQAEATRAAILDAARALFTTDGWAPTTMAAIARRAGVATETVYARFHSKRAIVHALVVAAMRGNEPETPFMEQAGRQAVQRETDAGRMTEAFAADVSATLVRVAPILAVVRSAAEGEPEMRDLYLELHTARRRNLSRFVTMLAGLGGLRSDITAEAAADDVWSLASPELLLLWTEAAGKSPAAHRDWLAAALRRLLLEGQ